MALISHLEYGRTEAGCDEAGRGCLAGPVFAASVILPVGFHHELLNDSKQLTHKQRLELRTFIEANAEDYAVAMLTHSEIDEINILRASLKAMHLALDQLKKCPNHILVDGNRFVPYRDVAHTCIIKGDGKVASIAAASILAKTYRDDYMQDLHHQFPQYNWATNKGYPTYEHRRAIMSFGSCSYHRTTFKLLPENEIPTLFEEME